MKNKFQWITVVTVFMLGTAFSANAQNFNVESVIMELQKPIDDTEKDLEKCVEWISAAAEHPKTMNKAKMHYWRGMTYLKIANVNSELTKATPDAILIALSSFNNAIETDAKNKYTEDAKLNLLNVAVGLYNKGFTEYQAGDYDASYSTFEKVLPLLEYDTEGQLKRNNLTTDAVGQMMAFCAMGANDDEKAKSAFQSLIDGGSTDPSNFINLAKLQLKAEDTTAALATVAAGRELNETNRDLINTELDIFLKQGRSKELIDKLDVAIEGDPGNTIYYFARAISYEGIGDLDAAGADYDKILEIDPEYYDASYNKGVMYLNKVSSLVDEMNEKGLYKASELAPYEVKIEELYAKAIVHFEHVFENNPDLAGAEKLELARTMRKIYAQLEQMDKYKEMKEYIDAN